MQDNKDYINIEVTNENHNGIFKVPYATSILDFIKSFYSEPKIKIVGGKVYNEVVSLDYQLEEDCKLELLTLKHSDGIRIYKKSLSLAFLKAVQEVFPEAKTRIMHSINKGIYCEVDLGRVVSNEDIGLIDNKLKELIIRNVPIEKITVSKEEAIKIFEEKNKIDKIRLLEYKFEDYVELYKCGELYEFANEVAVPSTKYIDLYELLHYGNGVIIRFPNKENPYKLPKYVKQEKMGAVFSEYRRWLDILGIYNLADLNDMIKNNEIDDIIRVSEALHEKRIASIADMISERRDNVFLVLIAGPSSSGKTTFAQRLSVQLRVNGFKPVGISLDDYFINREFTPVDDMGEPDFENLDALDVKLFNENLKDLLEGKETEIPIFNFHTGNREKVGRKMKMEKNQIIVIEGIHGLNEKLTESIEHKNKFKIYVSALTQLNVDSHTRIATTDLRLIRRIVRDNKYRSSDAAKTIKLWPSVRRGEEKNIFPFQEQADIIFNSALVYELSILKKYAMPLLKDIDRSMEQYSEAARFIRALELFSTAEPKQVPNNSIIREFIGGSCFF